MISVLERPQSGPHIESVLDMGTSDGWLSEIQQRSVTVSTGWGIDGPFNSPAPTLPPAAVSPPSPSQSSVALLDHIRSLSSLTWEQIARLLSVSRRSIHLWLTGGRLSAANEERLIRFEALLSSWPGPPEDRRHRLFQTQASGRSVFDDFRYAQSSRPEDINRPLEPLPEEQ